MKRVITIFVCTIFVFITMGICTISSCADTQLNNDIEESNSINTNSTTPAGDFVFNPVSQTITSYTGLDPVVEIPSTINGVQVLHIGPYAFILSQITSVTIPEGVLSIDYRAFFLCQRLLNISIPSSVKIIDEGAFFECTDLENVTLPNGLQTIGKSAFLVCYSLKEITIPNSVSTLGESCFYACDELLSLTLSNQIIIIPRLAFCYCSIQNIVIPDSVKRVEYQAFYGNYITGNLKLSNNLEYIGEEAFSHLTYLKSLVIPDSVTDIDKGAFMNGESLESITLPKNLNNIGPSAFSLCVNLKNIVIPSNVNTVGEKAFAEDYNLESATFTGNAPTTWGDYIFQNAKAGFKIYYYAENTGFSTPEFNGYPCYPLYLIKTAQTSGGTVVVSPERAAAGDTVTVVATPDTNKTIKSIYYTDSTGRHYITGTEFTMPDSSVTVSAIFIFNTTYQIIIAFGLIFVLSIMGLLVLLFVRS